MFLMTFNTFVPQSYMPFRNLITISEHFVQILQIQNLQPAEMS